MRATLLLAFERTLHSEFSVMGNYFFATQPILCFMCIKWSQVRFLFTFPPTRDWRGGWEARKREKSINNQILLLFGAEREFFRWIGFCLSRKRERSRKSRMMDQMMWICMDREESLSFAIGSKSNAITTDWNVSKENVWNEIDNMWEIQIGYNGEGTVR